MQKSQSMIIHVLKREKNISQLTNETYQTKQLKLQQNQLRHDQSEGQKSRLCFICCKMCKLDDMVSVGNCDHVFCVLCTRSHLQQKMVSYMKLTCCEEGCLEQLVINSKKTDFNNIRYYYHSLTINQQKKIKKYIKQLKNLTKKSIKRCKKCIKNPKSDENLQKCDQCRSQKIQIPQNFKKCPNCKKIIQKVKGCDHVKCICGFQFCFLCYQEWNRSHVCQFKVPTRTGLSGLLCFLFKMIIYFLLVLILAFFVTSFSLFICLVSSGLLGFFLEITIIEKLSRKKQIPQFLRLIVLILSLIILPVIVVFSIIPGFVIPIVNICYKQKIFLDPGLISQFALNIFSCIVVVRLI